MNMVLVENEITRKQSVDFLMLVLPNGGFTDDQFFEFCQLNDNLRIERNAKGQIIIMALTGGNTGKRNFKLYFPFALWHQKHKKGEFFDSSTGFRLPNGATYSPDVAWVSEEPWNNLTENQREKLIMLCPDFIVELLSASQHLKFLDGKMQEFAENGCRLGWLIDPYERVTHVYRPKVETEKVPFDQPLFGGQVLEGMKVVMSEVM